MAKWYAIPKNSRMSPREYRANISGMNIVFGAVLGFVLAGAGAMPLYEFAILLFMSAGAAIGVLYLSSSDYKLFYAALIASVLVLFPNLLSVLEAPEGLDRLPIVFAVWTAMVLIIELWPQDTDKSNDTEIPE